MSYAKRGFKKEPIVGLKLLNNIISENIKFGITNINIETNNTVTGEPDLFISYISNEQEWIYFVQVKSKIDHAKKRWGIKNMEIIKAFLNFSLYYGLYMANSKEIGINKKLISILNLEMGDGGIQKNLSDLKKNLKENNNIIQKEIEIEKVINTIKKYYLCKKNYPLL